MEKKIKVLICDDSAVIRHILTAFIEEAEDMELVGSAIDPYDAREKIKQLNPDVLTLDIEMPKMDGLSFLEKIMTLRPMPVIMVSTLTQRGADATLRALELGAFDYLGKPEQGLTDSAAESFRTNLLNKIRAAASSRTAERFRARSQQPKPTVSTTYTAPAKPFELIAIGASTGGVEALRDVFASLPDNLPPITLVQHMPAAFCQSFAARLNQVSAVKVALAKHGEILKPGHAYIADGSKHLMVGQRNNALIARLSEGVPVSGHCPSVDVLFESTAHAVQERAVGVILTGMGRDGASGLLAMRQQGASTLGQNEASCVVYGMPKVAHLMGAVEKQKPLSEIAAGIIKACNEGCKKNAS